MENTMSKDTAMAQFLTFLGKHLPGWSPQDLDRMQKAAIGHPTALPDPIIARVRVPCIDVPCVSFHSLFDMAFVGTVSRPEIASDPKTYGFFEHLKMYNRAGHVIWNDAHVLAFCRPNGSDGLAYAIIGCNNWISLKWGEFSGIVMDRQRNIQGRRKKSDSPMPVPQVQKPQTIRVVQPGHRLWRYKYP